MSNTPHDPRQQVLINAFERLDSPIKQMLQVAAVADPMGRTKLIELSNEAGIRNKSGKQLLYRDERAAIEAAIDAGLLEFASKGNAGKVQVPVLLRPSHPNCSATVTAISSSRRSSLGISWLPVTACCNRRSNALKKSRGM